MDDFVFPFCDLSDDQFEAIYYEPRLSVAPDGTRQQFRGQWYPLENDDAYTRRIWGQGDKCLCLFHKKKKKKPNL